MRLALAEETLHATGLKAKIILESLLDPTSYDAIIDLLEKYDGHVIEFSCWERKVGIRRTMIWEVRDY
jgi:hypothetical protein